MYLQIIIAALSAVIIFLFCFIIVRLKTHKRLLGEQNSFHVNEIKAQRQKHSQELYAQIQLHSNALDVHNQKHVQELNEQRALHSKAIDVQRLKHSQALLSEDEKHKKYQEHVHSNFGRYVPYGERLLIKAFRRMFEVDEFKDFTIYSHLEFDSGKSFMQVDFLVVSPKGLFVVESKCWKGITYICTKEFDDLFKNAKNESYKKFGVGSSLDIRVFNAQACKTNEKTKEIEQILLSSYQNPFTQARKYSAELNDVLICEGVNRIKNVVVFNTYNDYEVLLNDNKLIYAEVDNMSSVTTNNGLESYFKKQPHTQTNTKQVVEYVDQRFNYLFKMDSSNYQKAPFDFFNRAESLVG